MRWFFWKKKKKRELLSIRVAVFGGSFDPIHKMHIEIIKKLRERFDKVIVVPTKISPFKPQRITAADEDRLNMVRLAVGGIEGVEVSDFEINNVGVSYTFATISKFAESYSEITYVIGSELLNSLNRWKNLNELKKLTSFLVVPRTGYELDATLISSYERNRVKIQIADFSCDDISSAMIRVDVAFNRHSEKLDKSTFDYINEHNLYGDYRYIVDRYEEFELSAERIEHTYNAVKVGIRLAKIHDVDVDKVVTALLLHDIGKNTSLEKLSWLCKTDDLMLDVGLPESCLHAPIGAYMANKIFNIEDIEIINAIKSHTSGEPFMNDLQKIVAIADYIEEGRSFEGIDEIRRLAVVNLDACMEAMLRNTVEHLEGREIYSVTLDALDYFRMIINNTK